MMKVTSRRLLALGALSAIGTASLSATLDLATYLSLTPGNWAIFQDEATGAVSGYVVAADGTGQISQTWYRLNGSVWEFDVAEFFNLSNRKITYLGFSDGSATWLFQPTLTIPRRQQVNDATVYKGALQNQTTGQSVPVSTALSITAESLNITVPAGGFANCIKVRNYSYQNGQSRDSVSISCPNRSEARTWYTKIKDTVDPLVEDLSQSHSLVMTQGGDSNPPFP